MTTRHTFLVIETSLPGEGTIDEYRRSRRARRRRASWAKRDLTSAAHGCKTAPQRSAQVRIN